MAVRPVIIDPADGPCEICLARKAGKCDKCHKNIKNDDPVNMGGSGYQSVQPSHFHLKSVEGIQGRQSFFAELCLACHNKDRASNYGRTKKE